MKSEITHIGIKQSRQKGFRYKRLQHSGIFRGNDTRQKLIDCQGPFQEWTNASACNWIQARVKEQKEGRKVHIVCNCCDSREFAKGKSMNQVNNSSIVRVNRNCYGGELVQLISQLAKEESK